MALFSTNPADWGIPHDVYVTISQYSNKTQPVYVGKEFYWISQEVTYKQELIDQCLKPPHVLNIQGKLEVQWEEVTAGSHSKKSHNPNLKHKSLSSHGRGGLSL